MNRELQQPVTAIKGIGEETSEALREMGITTIEELFMHIPYRYEDYEIKDLAEVKHDEKVTVEGKVHSEPSLTYYAKKKIALNISSACGTVFNHRRLFQSSLFKRKIIH